MLCTICETVPFQDGVVVGAQALVVLSVLYLTVTLTGWVEVHLGKL